MNRFVFCPRKSTGALELVKALNGKRLRDFDGKSFWDKKAKRKVRLSEGDILICWGAQVPEIDGVKVLNANPNPVNKRKEIEILVEHGVPTVAIAQTNKSNPKVNSVYMPRSMYHSGGLDLLGIDKRRVDYWVKRESLTNEYRVHSFDQKSIRAGIKVPRDGFVAVPDGKIWLPNKGWYHPWIRSFDGGWRIKYDGFQTKGMPNGKELRNLAHQAVKSLGLTFGAVDIGQRDNGQLIVLEVNTAPGIEGGSLQAYVKTIEKWISGEEKPKKAPRTPDVNLD